VNSLIQVVDVSFSYQKGGNQQNGNKESRKLRGANLDSANLQGRKALDGVSFAVRRGEFVAVVGSNGSGKSTLAKHLNGMLLPGAGQVLVNGIDSRDDARAWDIRRIVGMVFQHPDNQLVGATVEEDVAFGPENLGVEPGEIRQRINQALAGVEMGSYLEYQPQRLSGGQKQRVAIAGVLAMQPECLVLDEATSMLDPQGRQMVLDTIHRLHTAQGLAVVLITHFMEEALRADRVVVMNEGRIVLEGTPQEVFCQMEKLKALGLDVPVAMEFGSRLRRLGWEAPEEILELDDLVNYLAKKLGEKPGMASLSEQSVRFGIGSKGELPDLITSEAMTLEAMAIDQTPIIQLKQAYYTYGLGLPWEHQALAGIDLVVEQGEFLGIAGHTGSGKSTLVQLFNGLIQPVSGQVQVMGLDIWGEKQNLQSLRGQVGLVFQFPEHQLFETTVFDEVAFGPRNLDWSEERITKAVGEALAAVGLDAQKYGRVSPFALSGGQQRRVAIAGILAMKPSVLVLDEPVAGFDPQGRRELLELLLRLNKTKKLTVVMVSHNMEELALCAKRLVVLNQGRKVLDGPIREVFSQRKELQGMGLSIPEGTKLVLGLRELGIPVPSVGALTWEEAWETVEQLLKHF
jgi:energy-coupling factor transport system ATP-binding protein